MKHPRPQDYDPTYKKEVKAEEFDVSALTPIAPEQKSNPQTPSPPSRSNGISKRRGARPKRTPPQTKPAATPNVRPERAERPERVAAPPAPAPAELGGKREIKRHSFEFYRDQLPKLKRLKAEFMIRGMDKSMSAMVREAVDTYIEAHSS